MCSRTRSHMRVHMPYGMTAGTTPGTHQGNRLRVGTKFDDGQSTAEQITRYVAHPMQTNNVNQICTCRIRPLSCRQALLSSRCWGLAGYSRASPSGLNSIRPYSGMTRVSRCHLHNRDPARTQVHLLQSPWIAVLLQSATLDSGMARGELSV